MRLITLAADPHWAVGAIAGVSVAARSRCATYLFAK